jgi:glyoxylase-like metal-dependent hydrolase (beta-lactamase superfamily II)
MNTPDEKIEITAERLVRGLEGGEPIQVLDVRAPERLQNGTVEPVPPDRFVNRRGSEVLALEDLSQLGLDPSDPVVVVCGHGSDSRKIAEHLNGRGFVARSLHGGINAWMMLTVPRELPAPSSGFDRLIQFDRIGKGALGYVLISDDAALVIDPPRDFRAYLDAVERAGARVTAVADTHVHADYISGGPALAAATGARYTLHPADAVFPYDDTPGALTFEPLEDRQVLEVGRGRVTARHVPGHTEGSVTFEVGEEAAFTGDFLFIDSVGRPDLAGKTEAWAEDLFRSLRTAKEAWPASMRIYPAHYATDAERNPDRTVGRTFGRIMEHNEPLRLADPAAFRTWVTEHVSTPPEAYRKIKAINVDLLEVDPTQADELEAGKNECALG